MLVWFGQSESRKLGRVGYQRGNGIEGQIIKSLVGYYPVFIMCEIGKPLEDFEQKSDFYIWFLI